MCPLILWTAKLTVRKQKPFSTTFDVHRDTNQHTSSYITSELKEVTDGCFFPQNINVVYCKYINTLVILWNSNECGKLSQHQRNIRPALARGFKELIVLRDTVGF